MSDFKMGIQLYSLREELDRDFSGTLAQVAAFGFDGVEFAGNYGGLEPDALAKLLQTLHLTCCGMHGGAEEIADENSKFYTFRKALQAPVAVTSCCGEYPAQLERSIALCRAAGEGAKRAGCQFAYHNHACEFAPLDGRPCLDQLYDALDPKMVRAELDVCWIYKGGEDPARYIRRYQDRLALLHMKDCTGRDGEFTALGDGVVDLAACVEAVKFTSCRWLIYEQDTCVGDRMEATRKSAQYLKQLLEVY